MQSNVLKKSIWLGCTEGAIKGREETDDCLIGTEYGRGAKEVDLVGVGGCCHPHQAGVSAFSPHSW